MKKHFGEYKFFVRWVLKRINGSLEELLVWQMRQVEKAMSVDDRRIEGMKLFLMQAELGVLDGKGTHYFIETEDLAETLPKLVGSWELGFLDALANLPRGGCGVVHTTGKKARAIFFAWLPATETHKEQLVVRTEGRFISLWIGQTREEFLSDGGNTEDLDLVFALALYVHCFPTALRDGFPESAKHPAHYRGENCASVCAVPEIVDRDGPRPHFRHGHFRMLRDARFTRKRFQIIFVSETFVKGKVKTVTEP